ncbi:gibberellin 2-beta-dioxygenase 6-like [Dendrobium catenatum]|uniref:gibberellin 2-beta-dioxygenase 6-like n=1 Tax=Dendrobium catenatum TaxID=906689 RepID=UPI0009F5FF81|nr:gibberellin 2-beta-dioxygenase 6-like [Dendrobium catenatum]
MPTRYSESDPPFTECFSEIFSESRKIRNHEDEGLGESEPPLIDLENLRGKNEKERQACIESITKASLQWGFFQVVNHGISHELLAQMRREQKKIFEIPFEKKVNSRFLNDCYRWGTPTATSLEQFSWSEAFQFPIGNISGEDCFSREFSSLREVMEKLANAMSELAGILAKILAENLGYRGHSFPENSSKNTCFLRLNHYPKCTFSPKTFGLTPHTDSDFLTILHQDEVGGLHMMKDFKWVAVKPNPNALIVNIGDLFQGWSNDIYKSVIHKVVANEKVDRYSIAYFLCPSYESIIGSCKEPSLYKNFTFGEYRNQVQIDVKENGQKVGLSRFLR